MRPFRGIRIAIKSLTAQKLRVALALLAIMIGVASVTIMVGIGKGAEDEVRRKIQSMGTNLVMVSAGISRSVKGQLGQIGLMTTLTLSDAKAIEEECPDVYRIASAFSKKMLVTHDNLSYSTKVIGTVPDFIQIKNVFVDQGSFFDDDDVRLMSTVAVIGPTVAKNLFPDKYPVGEKIRIGKVFFRVIGVTASKGDFGGEDEDDLIFTPLRTAMNKLFNVTYLSHIFIEARSFEDTPKVQTQVKSLLRERHRLKPDTLDDFTIQNQADVVEAESAVVRTFSLLVIAIASVSMIIGGVGILGVMLLSVKERISEIGVRRAVGARRKDILAQFIVEASCLGVIGGMLGIIFGLAVCQLLRFFSGMPIVVSLEHMLGALIFSVLVGMLFGIYPSWKAANLDPITALSSKS
ncbi:MAG: ABC transporter permease [Syntrophaceae bacterium]|nr:ABC transporter permease [Syntrophaceae bacterium]